MADPIIRGAPDWGSGAERTFTGLQDADLELGNRHNWVFNQSWDGEIHFYEDFESDILHWGGGTNLGSGGVYVDAGHAASGNSGVRLEAPAGDGSYAYISRGIAFGTAPVVSLGLFAAPDTLSGKLLIELAAVHSGLSSIYHLRYTFSSGLIEIRTPSGYESVGTAPLGSSGGTIWLWLRVVADLENQVYREIMVGSERIPLNDSAYQPAASTYTDRLLMTLYYYNTEAASQKLYLDDLIISRNVQTP